MSYRSAHSISRRAFTGSLFSPLLGGFELNRRIPVALQLFSVRDACEKDLPGTLAAVSRLGYEGVEFAGFYRRAARDIRNVLTDLSIVPCGSHTPLDQVTGSKFDETVEFNRTIGNRNLIVPGFPREFESPQGWRKAVALLNDLSQRLEPHAMRIGYHNHSVEFQGPPEQRPWEIISRGTGSGVTLQLDLGNARVANADPIVILRQSHGRVRSVHVKDYLPGRPDVMLGSSSFDWASVFDICRSTAGTEWYIIEHESHDLPSLDAAAESLKRFNRLSAGHN